MLDVCEETYAVVFVTKFSVEAVADSLMQLQDQIADVLAAVGSSSSESAASGGNGGAASGTSAGLTPSELSEVQRADELARKEATKERVASWRMAASRKYWLLSGSMPIVVSDDPMEQKWPMQSRGGMQFRPSG